MEHYKIIAGHKILFCTVGLILLEKYSWTASLDVSGRITCQVTEGRMKGKHFTRLLLNCPDNLVVDHKDGNSFNNTLSNLRLATLTQNQANRKVSSNNKSGVKGVSWCAKQSKWKAYIQRQHLGYFENLADAKTAYEKAAAIIHGNFALHISRPALNGEAEYS